MYRTAIIGILGVSLTFLMACEATTGKTTVQSIDDAAVTASVQGKLTADKLSNFSRINVDTERSVVTLNGVVRSVEEKSRAEDLARRTAGVRTVLNNLQIQSLADNVNASTETEAGDKQMNAEVEGEPAQRVQAIKGEVLRVEGDTYFVKGEEGKEVRLNTDQTTHKTGDINQGDRIEAQMNEENHALSIRYAPTTDRRNEHTVDQLCAEKPQSQYQSGDLADGCK
jgi:hyperosmotically inducible protein